MKRNLFLWQLSGFGIVSLAGTILHYLYEWTSESAIAALFSGVNESTWEHMKLLFFPLFAFALIQSRFFKDYDNFWCVKLRGIIFGILLIPIIFYTLNGIFGKTADWINILIFFISAAGAFVLEMRMFRKEKFKCRSQRLALITLFIISALFVLFTFVTPEIPVFKDPVSRQYGISD